MKNAREKMINERHTEQDDAERAAKGALTKYGFLARHSVRPWVACYGALLTIGTNR